MFLIRYPLPLVMMLPELRHPIAGLAVFATILCDENGRWVCDLTTGATTVRTPIELCGGLGGDLKN